MRHPFNVIFYKAELDDPISQFATPVVLVCGHFLLNNAQLVMIVDLRYENKCFFDMGSGLPVEAVAIAAELKKGRSRTRAFPNPLSKPCAQKPSQRVPSSFPVWTPPTGDPSFVDLRG